MFFSQNLDCHLPLQSLGWSLHLLSSPPTKFVLSRSNRTGDNVIFTPAHYFFCNISVSIQQKVLKTKLTFPFSNTFLSFSLDKEEKGKNYSKRDWGERREKRVQKGKKWSLSFCFLTPFLIFHQRKKMGKKVPKKRQGKEDKEERRGDSFFERGKEK